MLLQPSLTRLQNLGKPHTPSLTLLDTPFPNSPSYTLTSRFIPLPAMPSVAERSNQSLYPTTTSDWVQPESRPAEIDGLIAGVGQSFLCICLPRLKGS